MSRNFVVRMHPQSMPLAVLTMKKTVAWVFISMYAYGSVPIVMVLLLATVRRRSSTITNKLTKLGLQHSSLILIGHSCYDQLIPVKTRYPVACIMHHIAGLSLEHIKVTCFVKVDR